MKIGIDLRPLQTGHKYRGIGEVAKRVTNGLLKISQNNSDSYIFFRYKGENDPLEFLDIPKGLKYEVRFIGKKPGKDKSIAIKLNRLYSHLLGNPIKGARDCDVFLQYDYNLGVPSGTKTVLVKHDIIPFIFKRKHFISPWVHFKNKAARTTLRTIYHNNTYKYLLKRSLRRADKIICVSHNTLNDLSKYLGVSKSKMSVVYLGVDQKPTKNINVTSKVNLPDKPYLFFVGATDGGRRNVKDIIDAFNNLNADGKDIALVLAGENFKSEDSKVLDKVTKKAIKTSSYKDNIYLPGYISDVDKAELYKNALAFVFPTKYEGFGIPVLEAMSYGCPVITYQNSSIPEVAGDNAIYVKGWQGINNSVKEQINKSKVIVNEESKRYINHASKYSWDKTSNEYYKTLTSNRSNENRQLRGLTTNNE